ncbi:MAG: HlyU family transcriptional regulator [Nitrospira sp.]
MGTGVAYQGFVILPAPRPLGDVDMWEVNLHIAWSTQDGAQTRHFFTADKYGTEEEAAIHCVAYGKLIIDGKIPGVSVG